MSTQPAKPLGKPHSTQSIDDIFDDIALKFFYNLPDTELQSWSRLLFQLQQAYWFYIDNYQTQYSNLPHYNERNFIHKFFKYSKLLATQVHGLPDIYNQFRQYINSIPVYGSILLDPTYSYTVLVKSYHSNTWGWPRGKLDQNETEVQCCIRETYEEIGYDITHAINNEQYIDCISQGKHIRLYIVENIDMNVQFETKTQYEISDIQWIPIADLPSRNNTQGTNYKYGNVLQFAIKLRDWLKQRKKSNNNTKLQQRSQSHHTNNKTPLKHVNSTNNITTSNHKSNNKHRSHSTQRTKNDSSKDAVTFGDDMNGWSAEQMFKLNETKYGVKSTVPTENLDYSAYDTLINSVLGKSANKKSNKQQNVPQQSYNASNSVPATPAKPVIPVNKSHNTASKPNKHNKSQHKQSVKKSSSTDTELDFSHNAAYTAHSYSNIIQQPQTQPTTGNDNIVITTQPIDDNAVITETEHIQPNNNKHNPINEFSFDTDSIFKSLSVA